MSEYNRETDKIHNINLDSKITSVIWKQKVATVGERASFVVTTHFVGNGSDIDIDFEDKKGSIPISSIENPDVKKSSVSGKVYGDEFMGTILIPENTCEEIKFTAKLNKHGLKMQSTPIVVYPKISVTNLKWGQKDARRGDVVKLSADINNVPDEMEVIIGIYEYDQDGAHDFITKFPSRVKSKKIQAEWAYEYHEDTDEIPTDEEMKKYGKKYNPPEYFFMIDYHGKRFGEKQESKLLEFKDWIEIRAYDSDGNRLRKENFAIIFADGTKKKGQLDDDGFFRMENIPPGKYHIEFEDWDNDFIVER